MLTYRVSLFIHDHSLSRTLENGLLRIAAQCWITHETSVARVVLKNRPEIGTYQLLWLVHTMDSYIVSASI